jgi:hypothetical protein
MVRSDAEQIAHAGLTEPDRFDALAKRLAAMVRDGQLLAEPARRLTPCASGST